MCTKLEQHTWIKIEVARGRNTQECFKGLHEALGCTETHHSSQQCKESHHCCCHGPQWEMQWEILEHLPHSPVSP